MIKRIGIVVGAMALAIVGGASVAGASPAAVKSAPAAVQHVVKQAAPDVVQPMTVENTSGNLTKDKVTTYTKARTVTVSGSNIYVQKTDGPGILVRFYRCGDTSYHGNWSRLANADPTGYVLIGTNFAKGAKFCLQAWDDQGNNATDTWTGNVKWNVG